MDSFTGQVFKFILGVAIILGVTGAVLRTWFVDVVVMGHNGMAPTIVRGDTVLMWRGATPEASDIVLCRHPQEAGRFVVGRVIATAGAQLRAEHNQLYINNRHPDQDAHSEIQWHDPEANRNVRMAWGYELLNGDRHLYFRRNDRPFTMRPIGAVQGVYLLGDNRSYQGEDSRVFGVVQPSNCMGQVFMRIAKADGNVLPDPIPYSGIQILD